MIRLITRLIFTWFLKEKSLVPDELFEPNKLKNILNNFEKLEETSSTYYQSILQNLFFATLNTEMGKDDKGANHRRFKDDTQTRNNTGYMVHNLYRYQSSFVDPSQAVQLFGNVPFLNGGLFECLDREANKETNEKELRIDGFSDKLEKRAVVPNALFFSNELNADLSKHLGTKFKNAKVRGILEILNGYKFTVTENTPIEEEVALDPELLGKVFENLLAAYNPETEETARKQTGSFYTPRDVVDFMVDESLIAYLHHALTGGQLVVNGVNAGEQPAMLMPENDPNLLLTPNVQAGDKDHLEEKLRRLFSYSTEYKSEFSSDQISKLITAIDTAKILDPACGSGAFPMGVLQKLVFVLGRLDPNNQRWKEQQRERSIGEKILEIRQDLATVQKLNDSEIRDQAVKSLESRLQDIERAFDASTTDFDYARKLFLIENCIYGVDIQPIAVQIAKLRCFISLVIDQKVDDLKDNRGILPLPNLETKFVAANSLMPLGKQTTLFLPKEIDDLETELETIRHEHFRAKNFQKKKALRNKDTQIRQSIAKLLEVEGYAKESAQRMAAFDPYNQNSSAPFFDPHWMFGLKTGFDLVIGNPPYGVKLSNEQLSSFKQSYKIKTSETAILFIEKGIRLLNSHGNLSYIVPKAFTFASNYTEIRDFVFKGLNILVDCGKVFDKVKLEACVFHYQKGSNFKDYRSFRFYEDDLEYISKISKTLCIKFGFFLNGIIEKELNIGILMSDTKIFLKDIASNTRGEMLQSFISETGELSVIGGKEIDRYGIRKIKGKIKKGIPISERSEIRKDSILAQNIVAHIANPVDRIKIISCLPENSKFYILDTINQITIKNSLIKKEILWAFLCSKILNWYVYVFIFAKAIRTMHFDNPITDRIPIFKPSNATENLIIKLVGSILFLTRNGNQHAVMVAYLEQLIDALVYELYLPDILHAANRHPEKVIGADPLPEHPTLENLQSYYARVYDPKHEIRKLVFYLGEIAEIKIIGGKG